MAKLFANSGDPDQMPHSAASDLGLHCLPSTLLRVSDYNGLMVNLLNTTTALHASYYNLHILYTIFEL